MRILLIALTLTACGATEHQSFEVVGGNVGVSGEAPVPTEGGNGQALQPEAGGGAGGGAGEAPVHGGAAGEANEGGEGGEVSGSGGGAAGNGGAAGSGGVAAGGVGGSAAGAGNGGTKPDVDECSVAGIRCDGLCGAPASHIFCNTCNPFSASSGYVALGSASNPTNQDRNCGIDATMGLPVARSTCSKFTVQPGAHASFMEGRSGTPTPQCLVAVGMKDNVAKEVTVYVSRPDQNAWIHQEVAELVNGACPLVCP